MIYIDIRFAVKLLYSATLRSRKLFQEEKEEEDVVCGGWQCESLLAFVLFLFWGKRYWLL